MPDTCKGGRDRKDGLLLTVAVHPDAAGPALDDTVLKHEICVERLLEQLTQTTLNKNSINTEWTTVKRRELDTPVPVVSSLGRQSSWVIPV
ncbi:hypothetical protein ElyMa_001596300 [Elysia marginata]|uniref:Uncharacterized protein n=1 Tax=Elysia marginata TaxID=1093978 RepID=A0AAV4JJE7_9GAST|nr:hypothetical protein ElyMa_001596300 [Elysia marginata]